MYTEVCRVIVKRLIVFLKWKNGNVCGGNHQQISGALTIVVYSPRFQVYREPGWGTPYWVKLYNFTKHGSYA